jgi:O-antigen/teichoic acid export membrane protein
MKTWLNELGKLSADLAGILRSRERLLATLKVPLYANSVHLMLNAVVTALLGFVFWLLVARLYPAEEVGLASAAISAIQLLSLLTLLGLDFSLIRFLSPDKPEAASQINTSFTAGVITSTVAAVIFVLGLDIWSPSLVFIRQNGWYFTGFTLFVVAATAMALLTGIFVARRRAVYILEMGTAVSVIKIGLAGLGTLFLGAFGIFAAWGGAIIILVIIGVTLMLPRVQSGYRPALGIRKKILASTIRFSFANYVSNLLWTAPTYLLPLMVVNLAGAEANAYFYIAWALGGILVAFARSISLSLFAEGAYDETRLNANVRRSVKFTLAVLLPAILALLLLGDKLLLIYGADYARQGTHLLWLTSIASLPASATLIYLSVRRVQQKLAGLMVLPALITAITLGLSYFLLPRLGLTGAGLAWLAAQLTGAGTALVHWKLDRRTTEADYPAE